MEVHPVNRVISDWLKDGKFFGWGENETLLPENDFLEGGLMLSDYFKRN